MNAEDKYISREAVLKAFRLTAKNSNKDYQRGLQDAIDCLVPEVIADIPAADVQPVKHGKMIPLTATEKIERYRRTGHHYDGMCSVCYSCVFDTDNFCAECGARIGGDTE